MIVLDTSAAVALLDKTHPDHAAAVEFVARNTSCAIHAAAAAEVLVAASERGMSERVWDVLRSVGLRVADGHPDEPARIAQWRRDGDLSLVDACTVAIADLHEMFVFTCSEPVAAAARQAGLLDDRAPAGARI